MGEGNNEMERHKPREKRKVLKITLIILLALVAGITAYGYSIYHNITEAAKTVHTPIERGRLKLKGQRN